MLTGFKADADIRDGQINLSWTVTQPDKNNQPAFRLVRRRLAYPSQAEDGLSVLDMADAFGQAEIYWARIQRLFCLGSNMIVESNLPFAEMTLYFALEGVPDDPEEVEPYRVVIGYYEETIDHYHILEISDVIRVTRIQTAQPPWEKIETWKIIAAPGGGAEIIAGHVDVYINHADASIPDQFEWRPLEAEPVVVEFDRLKIHDTIANRDEDSNGDDGDTVSCIQVYDMGLDSEEVYYYALFEPLPGLSSSFRGERTWRASAMATGRYGLAERLYQLLPAIHKQYDEPAPGEQGDGQLRLFLHIFGQTLDHIRSLAEGLRLRHDLHKVHANMLPYLSQWIGWDLDRTQDEIAQRKEVRFAPEIYTTVGTVPNVRAMVNRITGWECRVKEFFHNVFRTNTPPELAIWMQKKTGKGWCPAAPFILDTAFEGAPFSLRTKDGTIWLFYHAHRGDASDIWYKNFTDGKWQPPERLTDGRGLQKYPAAVQLEKGIIRLFWSALKKNVWDLKTAKFFGKEWGSSKTILKSPFHDLEPTALVEPDLSGGIWLFWSSRRAGHWHIWYSRFDGKKWDDPKPLTTGDVNDRKPAAVFFENRIWVFWSRKTPSGWSLFYRTKQYLNFDELKWDPEVELSQRPPKTSYDDAEPYVLCTHIGILDLYWRSNRTGADNIWFRSYQTKPKGAWKAEKQITFGADLCQGPAVMHLSKGTTWLWYRSSKSVEYKSQIYSDMKTLDHRYSGCTSVDTRNQEKIQRRGRWEDDQTYTYDTAVINNDWYARDTVGLYITPDTEDANFVVHKQIMLKSYLRQFLPVNVRPVYIIESILCPETTEEIYSGLTDWYTDSLSERVVLRTVEIDETVQPPVVRYADHSTVDLTVTPPLKKYRTWSLDGS